MVNGFLKKKKAKIKKITTENLWKFFMRQETSKYNKACILS